MSYSTMIPFRADGSHGESVEFSNAWGLHAFVWDVLQRHLGWGSGGWLAKLHVPGEAARFWALANERRVPDHERIAMAATFDRVWVPAEHVPQVAGAFRRLESERGAGERVCHLGAAAAAMEQAVAGGAVGVGFWGTSVAENPWEDWDEDADEPRYLGPADGTPIQDIVPDLFREEL